MTVEPGMFRIADLEKIVAALKESGQEHVYLESAGEGTFYTPYGSSPMILKFHTKNVTLSISADLHKNCIPPKKTVTEDL